MSLDYLNWSLEGFKADVSTFRRLPYSSIPYQDSDFVLNGKPNDKRALAKTQDKYS